MLIHFNEILFDKHIKIQFMCRMLNFFRKIMGARESIFHIFSYFSEIKNFSEFPSFFIINLGFSIDFSVFLVRWI